MKKRLQNRSEIAEIVMAAILAIAAVVMACLPAERTQAGTLVTVFVFTSVIVFLLAHVVRHLTAYQYNAVFMQFMTELSNAFAEVYGNQASTTIELKPVVASDRLMAAYVMKGVTVELEEARGRIQFSYTPTGEVRPRVRLTMRLSSRSLDEAGKMKLQGFVSQVKGTKGGALA